MVGNCLLQFQVSNVKVRLGAPQSPIQPMGGSPGDVSENPVTQEKRKKGLRMSCDVGEATEGLENEL